MPVTLSPTLQAEQRSWHYWFEDGLPSLLTSAACLLMAFFLLFSRKRNFSFFTVVLTLTAMVLYGLILLRQPQILDWLKSKITYPRTGYVSPPYFAEDQSLPPDLTVLSLQGTSAKPREDANRLRADRWGRLLFTIALTLVAVLTTLFFRNPWVCSAAGLLLAAAMWFGAHREQRMSWIVLVGFPLAGFYTSIFLPRGTVGPERVAYFLAGGGALFFLDGAASLIRFLLRNPRPSSTAL
jgi:hypothetical protein